MTARSTPGCRCSPGVHVYKAGDPVCAALTEAGGAAGARQDRPLLPAFLAVQGAADLPRDAAMVHPHGWRRTRIRAKALAAIDATHFVPDQGRNRIGSHGRQPARLVHQPPARLGRADRGVRRQAHRRAAARPRRGRRASSTPSTPRAPMPGIPRRPSRFLGDDRDPDDYEQVTDIVDVWFESGSTHAFVLEARGLPWPADLYLEGSDQHRGWFHSSLLEAVGTRGVAPFKAVLTHGFVLDEQGRKMSKSLGNVTAPEEVCGQIRRRHPAPVGDDRPTPPKTCASARKSSSSRRSCIAGCATRCAGCWAAWTASPTPSACRKPRCRSWNAGCCTA